MSKWLYDEAHDIIDDMEADRVLAASTMVIIAIDQEGEVIETKIAGMNVSIETKVMNS